MKFFFPDSHDVVDPCFDFLEERVSPTRIRNRTDYYAHELMTALPYDGMLVSRAMVDSSRYTLAQKHRLLRHGARSFFHLGTRPLKIMGDCGAFSYFREDAPPYTVVDLMRFYSEIQVDYGLSLDHLIPIYDPSKEHPARKWRERQLLTLRLADAFLKVRNKAQGTFVPIGVAQGWSPNSYAFAVDQLQRMGYAYVALGGMASLRAIDILTILEHVQSVRKPMTKLHVLGISRMDCASEFARLGVASFDSTSPLRQSFKDVKDNYYTLSGTYPAIPVPQTGANITLLRKIQSGEVNAQHARELELRCLSAFRSFGSGSSSEQKVLTAVLDYQRVHNIGNPDTEEYGRVLHDQPWRHCDCDVCRQLGIEVILFRGAERNKRRGFHNLFVFRQQISQQLGESQVLEDERSQYAVKSADMSTGNAH